MKKQQTDIFGYEKPVQIETGEWWFNGRIIQKQDHPKLADYISYDCNKNQGNQAVHYSFKAAIDHAIESPCVNPNEFPEEYIGPFNDKVLETLRENKEAAIKKMLDQEIELEKKRKKLQRQYAYRYAPIRPGDWVRVFWMNNNTKEHQFFGIVKNINWNKSNGFIYEVMPTTKNFTPHGRHKAYHWVKENDEYQIIEKAII
jgi:hypothetical protein